MRKQLVEGIQETIRRCKHCRVRCRGRPEQAADVVHHARWQRRAVPLRQGKEALLARMRQAIDGEEDVE